MATYGAVTFEVKNPEGRLGWRPHWNREKHLIRRHIPHSNEDDVQFMGKGNQRLRLTIHLFSDADLDTLESYWGPTGRTLDLSADFGSFASVGDVRLVDFAQPKRWNWDTFWEVTVEFERTVA